MSINKKPPYLRQSREKFIHLYRKLMYSEIVSIMPDYYGFSVIYIYGHKEADYEILE